MACFYVWPLSSGQYLLSPCQIPGITLRANDTQRAHSLLVNWVLLWAFHSVCWMKEWLNECMRERLNKASLKVIPSYKVCESVIYIYNITIITDYTHMEYAFYFLPELYKMNIKKYCYFCMPLNHLWIYCFLYLFRTGHDGLNLLGVKGYLKKW